MVCTHKKAPPGGEAVFVRSVGDLSDKEPSTKVDAAGDQSEETEGGGFGNLITIKGQILSHVTESSSGAARLMVRKASN